MSTALSTHLPAPMEVRELLERLLGRDVSVDIGAPLVPNRINPVSMGVYVTDRLEIAAVSCADLAFSARASAALGLVPAVTAEDSLTEGRLAGGLAENLYEVLNISASLLNVGTATHVRLYAMHEVGKPTPTDVLARALVLGRRLDLRVEVAGYGSGRLSFVMSPV